MFNNRFGLTARLRSSEERVEMCADRTRFSSAYSAIKAEWAERSGHTELSRTIRSKCKNPYLNYFLHCSGTEDLLQNTTIRSCSPATCCRSYHTLGIAERDLAMLLTPLGICWSRGSSRQKSTPWMIGEKSSSWMIGEKSSSWMITEKFSYWTIRIKFSHCMITKKNPSASSFRSRYTEEPRILEYQREKVFIRWDREVWGLEGGSDERKYKIHGIPTLEYMTLLLNAPVSARSIFKTMRSDFGLLNRSF